MESQRPGWVGNRDERTSPREGEMQEPHEVKRAIRVAEQTNASDRVTAFEETYLLYGPRLRKIAISKFGIDAAEAESLVHDVFATYLMHAAAIRHLEPYLIGAICNAARNHLRRRHGGTVTFCGEQPCRATPKDALANAVERKVLLSRMLARVGGRCRELLHRYYANGETSEAIANLMNTTPGTVLVLLHRCRRRALAAYQAMTERN